MPLLLDKEQTLNAFWESFGWPAYDEGTVPEDAPYPRLTYNVVVDSLEHQVAMYASLWDRSTSWEKVAKKSAEISRAITRMWPPAIAFDGGRLFITKGSPFAQRMVDEDDMVRRIYINITAEYFSAE